MTIVILTGMLGLANAGTPELFDSRPAERWDLAYPVGNGTIGAMSFGAFPEEHIVLNNDTIWSRPRRVELPPGCRTSDMADAFSGRRRLEPLICSIWFGSPKCRYAPFKLNAAR